MPTILTNWDGLQGGFDKNSQRIFFTIQDSKETEYPYNNSSSSWTDIVRNFVNIYDGQYHYFLFAWNMSGTPINGASVNQHRLGLIGVDNYIFSPNTTNSNDGKSTPLSFVWNNKNKATNWSFGGFFPNVDSSTSKSTSNHQLTKCFNGYINKIIVWDTVLPGSVNFSNGVSQDPGSYLQRATQDVNPFTDDILKTLSSNVVMFYDFDRETIGSSTALDRAGSSVSGSQNAPTTGHTLNLFSTNLLGQTTYVLYDISNSNNTLHFPNGIIQFVNEQGISINVGTIFYEFGLIVFDNEYILGSNSGLPLLATVSTSGFGFNSSSSINVNYVSFESIKKLEKLIINAKAESDEFNNTQNVTGIIKETGEQFLKNDPATYVTTVGFYNNLNDLLAVAKLNKPIRKDIDHTLTLNVSLDF